MFITAIPRSRIEIYSWSKLPVDGWGPRRRDSFYKVCDDVKRVLGLRFSLRR